MLDRRTALLLKKINELCADGSYKVLGKEELLSAFPAYLAQSEEGLFGMICCLKERGYVDVKYTDKQQGLYCLASLPAGRLYAEKTQNKRVEEYKKFRRNVAATFCAAFAGALLAVGMAALFYVLII